MTVIDRRYSVAEGTAVKAPVRVATTANITLGGLQSIDGVTVAEHDRVLVKDQTTASENGIYEASTGNWSRTKDCDGAYDVVSGTRVLVVQGSENGNREYYVSTSDPITIGTTSLTWTQRNASSLTTTVLKSILDYIPSNLHAGIAAGTDVTDLAAYIQSGLDDVLNLYFPPGTYNIADELNPQSKQYIALSPGVKIKQTSNATSIFKATQKDAIVIDFKGGILFGKGDWDGPYIDHLSVQQSGSWGSNVGREERGVNLIGCTNCILIYPHIQNCGNAGVAIVGGTDNAVIHPKIEGTNILGTSLVTKGGFAITEANLQNGIYITTDATYGSSARTTIIGGDISNVGQAIMKEIQENAASDLGDGNIIEGTRVHDIVGQHGGYWQGGTLSGSIIARDVALQGWKVQSGNASADIHGVKMKVDAKNCSEAVVCAVIDVSTGSVKNCDFDITAHGCATGLTIQPVTGTSGTISGITAKVQGKNLTSLVDISGTNITDIDIYPTGSDFAEAGIYVTATNSSGLRFRGADIQRPNNNSGSFAGIHVASASASVELYNPVVEDDDHKMIAGIFNAIAGGDIKIYGSVVSKNANGPAIRADATISEFPAQATLTSFSGVNVLSGINNIRSSDWLTVAQESTGSTNLELWSRSLDDETALAATAIIVGKKSGTTQRKVWQQTTLAYRDGGGSATIQGSPADAFSAVASGSFNGVIGWQGDGNNLQLYVNSAGDGTYEWTAKVVAIQTA